MEIGSHYYAVLALCRMLGIKKDIAYRIAFSSEYVDDALIERVMFKRTPRGVRCHIFGRKRGLDHTATSPRIMTVWNYRHRTMREQLVPFHFIPGNHGESFYQRIRTFPDSPLLQSLINSAVVSGNSYQIGIVLHVLGDTYAHQGFSGIINRHNRVKGLHVNWSSLRGFKDRLIAWYMIYVEWLFSRIFGRILPMYSHSHVGTIPDIASVQWKYKYDTGTSLLAQYEPSGEISNPQRYTKAFEEIRQILLRFIKAHPEVQEKRPDFQDEAIFREQLIKPLSRREVTYAWKDFLLKHRLLDKTDEAVHYDPHAWIKSAFSNYRRKKYSQRIVHQAEPVTDFIKSDWYQYYRAAREYKEKYNILIDKYEIY